MPDDAHPLGEDVQFLADDFPHRDVLNGPLAGGLGDNGAPKALRPSLAAVGVHVRGLHPRGLGHGRYGLVEERVLRLRPGGAACCSERLTSSWP